MTVIFLSCIRGRYRDNGDKQRGQQLLASRFLPRRRFPSGNSNSNFAPPARGGKKEGKNLSKVSLRVPDFHFPPRFVLEGRNQHNKSTSSTPSTPSSPSRSFASGNPLLPNKQSQATSRGVLGPGSWVLVRLVPLGSGLVSSFLLSSIVGLSSPYIGIFAVVTQRLLSSLLRLFSPL